MNEEHLGETDILNICSQLRNQSIFSPRTEPSLPSH